MLVPPVVVGMLSVGVMVLGADKASGQTYPNKPIRILTSGVGGTQDFTSRMIAQGISGPLGQAVFVENRTSFIATELVAKASPDGYTLLVGASSFVTAPLLQDTPFHPVRDFSPITLATRSPAVLVVHPSLPVRSVKELISLAKARPGALNYASGATGSSSHLAGELFKHMTGVDIIGVKYKSTGPALNDLIGGQVQLMFAIAGSVMLHVESGRLRGVAVASAEPSVLAPGLPTMMAAGLPDYEVESKFGVFAPANTPAAVINRLNQEIVRFVKTPEAKEKFLNSEIEAVGSSPQEYAALIKAEVARMEKMIKAVGIRIN